MVITNPCIKFVSPEDIRVTDGDGLEFNNQVYFVSDNGSIYVRPVSTTATSSLIVETKGDVVVGVGSDKGKYLEITTGFNYDGWEGKSIIGLEDIQYDKRFINLREDEGEHIVDVRTIDKVPKNYKSAVKGSRVSKTTYFKL